MLHSGGLLQGEIQYHKSPLPLAKDPRITTSDLASRLIRTAPHKKHRYHHTPMSLLYHISHSSYSPSIHDAATICFFYSLLSIGQNPVLTKPALITAMTYAKRETTDRDSRKVWVYSYARQKRIPICHLP